MPPLTAIKRLPVIYSTQLLTFHLIISEEPITKKKHISFQKNIILKPSRWNLNMYLPYKVWDKRILQWEKIQRQWQLLKVP